MSSLAPGVVFNFGGQEYQLPGLALGQLRNGGLKLMAEHDKLVEEGKTWEAIAIRGQLVGMALKRNYPKMTDGEIDDILDTKNINNAWLAMLTASGFEERAGLPPTMGVRQELLPTTSGPSIESSQEPITGQ